MWNLKNFYLPKNSKTVTKRFRNGTISEKSIAPANKKMAVYEVPKRLTVSHFSNALPVLFRNGTVLEL